MLQTFARERGPARGGADEEAAAALIGVLPDQVANSLEAEHRVEDEERNHGHAVVA